MEYTVILSWDDESQVWIATSPDILGLVLESGSFDALVERLTYAVPDLLELNGLPEAKSINIRSERKKVIA